MCYFMDFITFSMFCVLKNYDPKKSNPAGLFTPEIYTTYKE